MDFSELVKQEVVQVAMGIFSIFFTYIVHCFASYFKTKTNNEKVKSSLEIIDTVLLTAVKEMEQTFKKDLIKSEGRLSPLNQKKIRDFAIDSALTNLKQQTKKDVQQVIPDIHQYSASKVEGILYDIKKQNTSKKDAIYPSKVSSQTTSPNNFFSLNK